MSFSTMKTEKPILDIAVINLSQIVPVAKGHRYKTGKEMDELFLIEDGAIGISGKKLTFIGKSESLMDNCTINTNTRIIDGREKIALPGFVDPHTHLIFSGTREHELELKLQGRTYLEILEGGGGILYTVGRTRAASFEELMEEAGSRLDRMILHGTTTVEAKSGYGLDRETELRSLRVIKELNERHPMDIIPTFLGAHAIPPEYKNNGSDYIDHLVDEVLPEVSREGLARYCDVFLEKGVFGVEESRKLLGSAKKNGLNLKLHIDEIENLGGAGLAMELGATSVEHLVQTNDDEIKELGRSGICCIFLPGTPFSLMDHQYPKARDFINSNCIVALATDLNPNCMTENMQNVITLACYKMAMTPAEAISAATINAAYGIGEEHRIGSLEVGKDADVIVLDVDDFRKIPYHFGVNHVVHVIKGGSVEVFGGRLTGRERYVYVYAFLDEKLMMVRNRKRGGWEIPGGRLKRGETYDGAARREFLEETGHGLEIVSSMEAEEGMVYYGKVGKKIGEFDSEEIVEFEFVDRLPRNLNFPEVEYRAYLMAAPERLRPQWI